MLKIAICEDDYRGREIIVEYVQNVIANNKLNAKIVCESGCYDDMNKFINTCNADLYILDIELMNKDKNKNGIELARSIRQKSKDIFVLFISGSNPNINDIFEVKAYNYLIKPFVLEYLEANILKIYNEFQDNKKHIDSIIDVYSGCSLYKIKLSEIVYIEKISNKCNIILLNGSIIQTYMLLSDIESNCKNAFLQRTHKSFLCNVSYIKNINTKTKEITMTTGDIVLLGGKYKDTIKLL